MAEQIPVPDWVKAGETVAVKPGTYSSEVTLLMVKVKKVTATQVVIDRGNYEQRFRLRDLRDISSSMSYRPRDELIDPNGDEAARIRELTRVRDAGDKAASAAHKAALSITPERARAAIKELRAYLAEVRVKPDVKS